MAEGFFVAGGRGNVGCRGFGGEGKAGGVAGFRAFERAGDEVAGAEADGEREREHDAAEQDAKGQGDDGSAELDVLKRHGGGEDQDEPLDAEREEAGVLETVVDSSYENGTGQETGDQVAGDENDDGSDGVGEVREEREGEGGAGGVGGVEGEDADNEAKKDAGPEGDAAGERGRGSVRGRSRLDRGRGCGTGVRRNGRR